MREVIGFSSHHLRFLAHAGGEGCYPVDYFRTPVPPYPGIRIFGGHTPSRFVWRVADQCACTKLYTHTFVN